MSSSLSRAILLFISTIGSSSSLSLSSSLPDSAGRELGTGLGTDPNYI